MISGRELDLQKNAMRGYERSLRCPFYHTIFHTPVLLHGINETVEEDAAKKLVSGELSYHPFVRVTGYSYNYLVSRQVSDYLHHYPAAGFDQYVPVLEAPIEHNGGPVPAEIQEEPVDNQEGVAPLDNQEGVVRVLLNQKRNPEHEEVLAAAALSQEQLAEQEFQENRKLLIDSMCNFAAHPQSHKSNIELAIGKLRSLGKLVKALETSLTGYWLVRFHHSLFLNIFLPELEEISDECLNFVIQTDGSKQKGESIVSWLCFYNRGQQALQNNPGLRSKISETALNSLHSPTSTAAIHWLCRTDVGLDILSSDPILQSKITSTSLNYHTNNAQLATASLLQQLTSCEKGREILCQNPHLRDRVAVDTFYREREGKSPALDMLFSEKCAEFFQHNPLLLDVQKMPKDFLKKFVTQGAYNGKSMAFWFMNSESGKVLLENNAALRSKVLAKLLLDNLLSTEWKWGLFKFDVTPRNIQKQIRILKNKDDAAAIAQVREIGKKAAKQFSFFRDRATQEFYDICADDNKFKAKFGL